MTRRLAALALLLLLAILLASSCSEDVSKDASPSSTPTPATTAGASATQAARGPRPVILVHGWAGSPRDMLPLKRFLDANGHHAFIAILPGEDNIENAEYLQAFVSEVEELTASDTVDIVGFSMGGLSSRYYIRFLGGGSEVGRYVSIDTPQYGDPAACLLPAEGGGQMCPFSDFLSNLNRGDDTPGDVTYTTILNQQSNPAFGRLRNGPREISVSGEHNSLLTSPDVHNAVLAALRG